MEVSRGWGKDRARRLLSRFDRRHKGKKLFNEDRKSPTNPDARIARMKNGATRVAYKQEHAVDLGTR